jgi:hypothetical protein
MTQLTLNIPTPEELLALIQKNGEMPADKNAFIEAFKTLYPALGEAERSELLKSLLAYVDSMLENKKTIAV